MNAREIIREIETLPRDEQVEVIRFVYLSSSGAAASTTGWMFIAAVAQLA